MRKQGEGGVNMVESSARTSFETTTNILSFNNIPSLRRQWFMYGLVGVLFLVVFIHEIHPRLAKRMAITEKKILRQPRYADTVWKNCMNAPEKNVKGTPYLEQLPHTNDDDNHEIYEESSTSYKNQSAVPSPWQLFPEYSVLVLENMTTWNASIHAPPRYKSYQRPVGLRLAMIGDSLMRYQFVMLIHYLHTGQWVELNENYEGLIQYFGGDHFICDCFRASARPKLRNPTITENEFYRDQGCHDNSVSMFFKAGDLGFRGHHTTADVSSWFQSVQRVAGQNATMNHENAFDNRTTLEVPRSKYKAGNFSWRYDDYAPFLRDIVANLEPRPRVVIINEGIWTVENLSNATIVRNIQSILRDLGMISIYKTTTKPNRPNPDPSLLPHDRLCCEIFDHCLHMDWTAGLPPEDYMDRVHFRAFPNIRSNEQLFELLESIGEVSMHSV